jgi:hypothetical protein
VVQDSKIENAEKKSPERRGESNNVKNAFA